VEVEFAQIYKTVGLGSTIWSPLASGFLTGKYRKEDTSGSRLERQELDWLANKTLIDENFAKVEKLKELAGDIGTSLPHLAINWCLTNPHVSTVILGASKVEQLEHNLKARESSHLLTPEVLIAIEEILQNKPIHPQY
jgi:aryl-alcohol dehydrogenase-like predicted oxidoreductase